MATLALSGATGRFGRAILSGLSSCSDLTLVAAITAHAGVPVPGFDPLSTQTDWKDIEQVDLVLDVSIPEGMRTALSYAEQRRVPFVTGVTGLTDQDFELLGEASATIPILATSNFSIGVTALLSLLPTMAASLPGYDVSIIDVHHRAKRDAPSGTARMIVDAVNASRRDDEQIASEAVLSVRAGGIPGQHCISFVSMGEEIRIEHRALSRVSFAEGAIAAVRWIVAKPPGLYSMFHVIA